MNLFKLGRFFFFLPPYVKGIVKIAEHEASSSYLPHSAQVLKSGAPVFQNRKIRASGGPDLLFLLGIFFPLFK
jgi:hypothetical protein